MDTPIYNAPANAGPTPHSYTHYHYTQLCDGCGSRHQWSEVFARTNLVLRNGGKPIVNHRRVDHMSEIQYNLPVKTIEQTKASIPFCFACLRPGALAHLPKAPAPSDARSELLGMQVVQKAPTLTRWQDKGGNWHTTEITDDDAPKGAKTIVKKVTKAKFTVDDL